MNAERAIKIIECFFRESDNKCANGECDFASPMCQYDREAAFEIALSALREKQERENPEPQSGVKGIWIEEDDDEIEITVHRRDKPVRICVGTGDVVIVEKLYGPAVLEDLRIECTYHGWKVSGDDVILESGELALEALREKAERDKGCEYCDDDCCPRLNWHYGLDHILPGYKYCPMCGRKLDHEPKEAR